MRIIPTGDTSMPMMIPTSSDSTPDTCPECGKVEKTKTVCVWCGHEYKEKAWSNWEIFGVISISIAVIAISIYVLFTIGFWLDDNPSNESLRQIVCDQWTWLKSKKVW